MTDADGLRGDVPATNEANKSLRVLCVESRQACDPDSMSSLLAAGCTVHKFHPTTYITSSSKNDNGIAVHVGLCLLFVALAISMLAIIVMDYWHNDTKAAWFTVGAISFVVLLLSSVVLLLLDEVNSMSASYNCAAIAASIQQFNPDVVVGQGYGGELVLKLLAEPTYVWAGPSVVVQPTSTTPALEHSIKQFPVLLPSNLSHSCDCVASARKAASVLSQLTKWVMCDKAPCTRRCRKAMLQDNLMQMVLEAHKKRRSA